MTIRRLGLVLAAVPVAAGIAAGWLVWAPSVAAPVTAHFDGHRFHNVPAEAGPSLGDHIAWMATMRSVPWPTWVRGRRYPPPPARVGGDRLRVTYINHATTLIQIDSLNILTDPVWSAHAGPFGRLGAARVRPPGVGMNDLPHVDYVLISHDHYDHLDLPIIRELERRFRPHYLVGLGVGGELPVPEDRVTELDWWDSAPSVRPGLRFTFLPARHQSGRLPFRANRTLWGGFVIESGAGRIYYAGDTGAGPFVDSIAARFRPVRLAILPIGGYAPRWFMAPMHMDPREAVSASLAIGAGQSIAVHFGTFAEHTVEPIGQPVRDLAAALRLHGVPPNRFRALGFGEGLEVPEQPNPRP